MMFLLKWHNQKPLSEEAKIELQSRLAGLAEGGDCNAIRRSAERVLSFDPANFDAQLSVAECDLKTRDLASAHTLYKTLVDKTGDARAIRGLGVIASLEGKGAVAETYLREAAAKSEEDWRIWNALGYALDQQEKWDESEAVYTKAAELNPEKGAPFNNFGMSLLQQDKLEEASGAFLQALTREPSLSAARLNLRIARALSGDYASALVGASEHERAIILNNIGVAAMSRGDYDDAMRYFRRALDEDPKFYAVAFENLERAKHLSIK